VQIYDLWQLKTQQGWHTCEIKGRPMLCSVSLQTNVVTVLTSANASRSETHSRKQVLYHIKQHCVLYWNCPHTVIFATVINLKLGNLCSVKTHKPYALDTTDMSLSLVDVLLCVASVQ
jgi:hypothetical protein